MAPRTPGVPGTALPPSKRALKAADVGIASLLPMYRWASNDETERQAALKHWKRAIEIAAELGVDTMNSEFGPRSASGQGVLLLLPHRQHDRSLRGCPRRSMEDLVPVLEREGIQLNIDEDRCETLQPALDIIRTVNSKRVKFLYCAPHTFYFGDDTKAMLREAKDVLAHAMWATPSTTRPARACAIS